MIETERLILRAFRDEDRAAFAAINGDPRVGDWLGGGIDRAASDVMIDRINAHIVEHGFGFWAAERRADGRLIGAIGLVVAGAQGPLPPGALELAWRLHPDAQGQGLATEGAAAARDWAFINLTTDELVAMTAATNLASQAVMRRIGMVADPARDFDHPRLAVNDPLHRHVVFAAQRSGFAGPVRIG